jgi:hypothetical protein
MPRIIITTISSIKVNPLQFILITFTALLLNNSGYYK